MKKFAANKIKIISSLNQKGYQLKVKIPFEIFGINPQPEEDTPVHLDLV